MKKGRFLWSAHRITEKQKAGKARNIKEKQLKNSRSTVSRLHVALLSSPRDNQIPQNLCIYALCEWSKTLWSTFGQFKTSLFAQGGFLFAFMQGTARSVRQFGLLFYAKHQRRCQQLRSHHSDQDAQTRLSGRYRCLRAL